MSEQQYSPRTHHSRASCPTSSPADAGDAAEAADDAEADVGVSSRSISSRGNRFRPVGSVTAWIRLTRPTPQLCPAQASPKKSSSSENDFDVAVGFTVQQYLFTRRMTRSHLGELLGLPGPSISNRLRGKIKWTGEDIALTASALGVALTDLYPVRMDDGSWVPAQFVPGQQKAPAPAGAGAPSLVAGTGFEPATSGV